jgi:CMP-N,N'-diacetyllegionaminic acid synthase
MTGAPIEPGSSATGVLAVIIGRAGSKGLPGKNARLVAGRPIIAHTIDDALAAEAISRVVVSTDGAAIADAARALGVQVVQRPAALASDTATVDSAVRHAVESLQAAEPIVVVLYANVPVRPADLIDRAVGMLRATRADSVQSYSPVGKHHPYWMMRLDDAGRVTPYIDNTVYRRQDLPRLLIPDGGVIAVTRRSLFTEEEGKPHAFLGADRRGIESWGPIVDIDDAADLAVAEAMLAASLHEAGR